MNIEKIALYFYYPKSICMQCLNTQLIVWLGIQKYVPNSIEVNFKYRRAGHFCCLGSACKNLMKLHVTAFSKGCQNLVEKVEFLCVLLLCKHIFVAAPGAQQRPTLKKSEELFFQLKNLTWFRVYFAARKCCLESWNPKN